MMLSRKVKPAGIKACLRDCFTPKCEETLITRPPDRDLDARVINPPSPSIRDSHRDQIKSTKGTT